MPEPVARRVTE